MHSEGIVPVILPVHILAGTLALAFGIPALQAAAVLVPIAVMLYWLWRLRARRTSPVIAGQAPVRVSQ